MSEFKSELRNEPQTFTPDEGGLTVNGRPRTVVCAALLYKCGTIIVSVRHFDAFARKQVELHKLKHFQHKQGFVDQWGNFMNREEAWHVATTNRQKIDHDRNGPKGTLYSEGLY